MFSKNASKIHKIFTIDLMLYVKSTVKILSIFVAFLENMNFIDPFWREYGLEFKVWIKRNLDNGKGKKKSMANSK